jgi:hypothetical protein
VEATFRVNSSTRGCVAIINVVERSAFQITGDVTFEPNPVENDEIEYTVIYKGAHLMPVYSDDVSTSKPLKIAGQAYSAFDGVIPVTPIQVLELEFRLPASAIGAVQPEFFVGSYSRDIDYLVESEIERAIVIRQEIGDSVVVRATVNSALLRHVYGVAWEPPPRPANLLSAS